ncbi:MAG: valine--tRNA ligase [Acidobacteriales bacterium]|nr:valine--tRNA ligase [Terriglobales bacterium]
MPHELPKAYDPGAIEEKWAQYWVEQKLFHLETPASAADVFTLLLPPPNVTGRLHMGHMLNQTEMDIIIRWHRMRGHKTLWVPGTDHAGIATQMMVERRLESEGKKRAEMGREAFVERVWEWRRHYGGAILGQMKRLGASVDWQREYFTMDDNLSRAVREAFVRLHEAGKIYRGAYIVNWCPRCVTAISDLEVVHEEVQGKLYEVHYPLAMASSSRAQADASQSAGSLGPSTASQGAGSPAPNATPSQGAGLPAPNATPSQGAGLPAPNAAPFKFEGALAPGTFITVATTRPETILGDVAIAVNPNDERYKSWIGKTVLVPLMGREVPIIADDWAKPEFGTGAVKVTPAHDPNDFAIGQRHDLPQLNIMDEHARLNENAVAYQGLDRYVARKRVLADLESQGLLGQVKDHLINVGKCDRCKTVVEPRLSTQWFLQVQGEIAQRAIDAVEQGHIRITPENYKTIYLNWMRGIYDWCISRQLWWGHRIPAWHCAACKEVNVAREAPAKCRKCGNADLAQDTDVLDTWFSSALLPFTCFGWPEKTKDLEVFYPTSLLITGFDILFFWVARMIMMGTWFMGGESSAGVSPAVAAGVPPAAPTPALSAPIDLSNAVPFKEVYIHALVRDKERQKMSKTKGNVLDPIEITERYGTDAVRFTLASMAAPGTDIAFNEERTEGYRAFANKIWNAARFIFMNVERARQAGVLELINSQLTIQDLAKDGRLEDVWIYSRLNSTALQINAALNEFRFDEAATRVYDFFWKDFCDWYLEAIKLRLEFEDQKPVNREAAASALFFMIYVFDNTLRLLAPFMPFIAEELWNALHKGSPFFKPISLSMFPTGDFKDIDLEIEEEMRVLQNLVADIRNLRVYLGAPPKQPLEIEIWVLDEWEQVIRNNESIIEKLANVQSINYIYEAEQLGPNTRQRPEFQVRVVYEKQIDVAAERERLTKELKKLETELANAQRNLANESFLTKAPASVVEGIRKREAELKVLIEKSRAALSELPA